MMLCLASMWGSAQVVSLGLNNNTSHDVWVIVYGEASATCGTTYSAVVHLTSGNSIGYTTPASVLPSANYFTRVRLLHGDPSIACITPGGSSVTGSGCAGPSTASVSIEDVTCTTVYTATVDWLPQAGSAAIVEVN